MLSLFLDYNLELTESRASSCSRGICEQFAWWVWGVPMDRRSFCQRSNVSLHRVQLSWRRRKHSKSSSTACDRDWFPYRAHMSPLTATNFLPISVPISLYSYRLRSVLRRQSTCAPTSHSTHLKTSFTEKCVVTFSIHRHQQNVVAVRQYTNLNSLGQRCPIGGPRKYLLICS